ncbi:TIGR00730 family Rossman fold protein [Thiolinea disciformis]|uniref:LOG family protein n=1 Tax=Thiolinea disciformis TaxID=125614 RepID=UPI000375799C|nr:TIGR00730 family Rossman fold protein [Thiolinea disciformis]
MTELKHICVYCGSNLGRQAIYKESAQALGKALVERDLGLVYGGAHVGLMGVLADTVMSLGGRVIGIMPESLMQYEVAHHGLTRLEVVPSMHERKHRMAELSDGFIALPGGVGTLEELFEIWTWAQLSFHQKPCGLLNIAGYYDQLHAFLKHTVDEQFVKSSHYQMLLVEQESSTLLERFAAYQAPIIEKWHTR